MGFEQLLEQPKEPQFIALSYAQELADEDGFELAMFENSTTGWEVQIQEIDPEEKGQRTGPTLEETQFFISKLTEYLDEDYPTHEWRKMLSVTVYAGRYRIKFETT